MSKCEKHTEKKAHEGQFEKPVEKRKRDPKPPSNVGGAESDRTGEEKTRIRSVEPREDQRYTTRLDVTGRWAMY